MVSSKGDEWFTPMWLYDKLNRKYRFLTDPCAERTNRLGTKYYYTKEDDGLRCQWYGNVFINPPYGKDMGKWVTAGWHWAQATPYVSVMLIPARTDTSWFHDFIWNKKNVDVEFLRGRLKFENPNHIVNTAPFPSMVAVFN